MLLTLVVPGLLWPRQIMKDTLRDYDFPALQTMLGKCKCVSTAEKPLESWWADFFGSRLVDFAAAPLRLAALGENPGTSRWLCADPVHLRIDQKGLSLTDPALLNIGPGEARQFQTAVAPLLEKLGDLRITTPSHWHIRLKHPLGAFPANLNEHIEHSALGLLPAGDAGREWRQVINEVQMLLHSHPINTQRVAHGKAAINSIALWGEGVAATLPAKPGVTLYSDDLMLAGAGKLAGMITDDLPGHFSMTQGQCVAYYDALRFSTAQRDALGWCDGLQTLEQDWLAPAIGALKKHKLKRIELHGFGNGESFSLALTLSDLLCFWRQTRRLESL